ncbi:MAG: ribonuclease III [Elusimicrobia bacterium]|nr:ribonuclease III [Elusimicrobiota bacterium]
MASSFSLLTQKPELMPGKNSLSSLEESLSYQFKNQKLLELALTHSSYSSDNALRGSNERLEFLGDSVFNLLIAEYLYGKFAEADEGKLSKLKSMLVAKKSLLELAQYLDLERCIMVGSKEDVQKKTLMARERENILADCAEAVIGSLYLDGGLEICRDLIINRWVSKKKRLVIRDYKSRLQEVIQKTYKKIPEYRLRQSWGPEHAKMFEVEACFEGKMLGRGVGKNKKEAEQIAAKEALRNVKILVK